MLFPILILILASAVLTGCGKDKPPQPAPQPPGNQAFPAPGSVPAPQGHEPRPDEPVPGLPRLIPIADQVAGFCDRMKSAQAAARAQAAQELGQLKIAASGAAKDLAELLHDQDHNCRLRAAWALGQIGAAATVATDDLLHLAATDVEPTVRVAAARALVAVAGDKDRVVEGLGKAFTAANPVLREKMAGVLADLGQQGAPLLGLLEEARRSASTVALQQALDRAIQRIKTGARSER